jgi:antitoxin FitA
MLPCASGGASSCAFNDCIECKFLLFFAESRANAIATLTIRNIEDDVKERLRVRAAQHGHSMEEEVRELLRSAVQQSTGASFWRESRRLFSGENGVELELPNRRGDNRPVPEF